MNEITSNLTSWKKWLNQIGVSGITGWRWRKQGLIKTVNIFGRLYISQDEIDRFIERATSGEFEQDIQPPKKEVAKSRLSNQG